MQNNTNNPDTNCVYYIKFCDLLQIQNQKANIADSAALFQSHLLFSPP